VDIILQHNLEAAALDLANRLVEVEILVGVAQQVVELFIKTLVMEVLQPWVAQVAVLVVW
jgi:hypothetical protein